MALTGHDRDFVFGADAHAGRLTRGSPFVVVVELQTGRFIELDADDADHGRRLAQVWTDPDRFKQRTASVRRVMPGGKLGKCIGGIYAESDYDDDYN